MIASVEIMEEKMGKYERDFVSVQHAVIQEGSETPSFHCWPLTELQVRGVHGVHLPGCVCREQRDISQQERFYRIILKANLTNWGYLPLTLLNEESRLQLPSCYPSSSSAFRAEHWDVSSFH